MNSSRLLSSCRAVVLGFLGAASALPGADTPRNNATPSVNRTSTAQETDRPSDIERLIWWLPEDTEGLVISKGRIPIGDNPSDWGGTSPIPEPYSVPPFRYEDALAKRCIEPLLGPTALYPGQTWGRMVKNFYGPNSAVLFAKAVRRFRDRGGEACDIVLFRDNTPDRIMRELGRFRSVLREVGNVRVLDVDLNNVPYSYGPQVKPDHRYLASPQRGVFVEATSIRLMKTIVERMSRRGNSRALPADLPEWRQVDLGAPAWAVRHYQAVSADVDSTSMLKQDPNGKGLVLFCGTKPSPFVALRYVSTSPDAGQRFMHMYAQSIGATEEEEKTVPPMLRVNTDAVEQRRRTNVSTEDALRDRTSMSVQETTISPWTTYLPFFGFDQRVWNLRP